MKSKAEIEREVFETAVLASQPRSSVHCGLFACPRFEPTMHLALWQASETCSYCGSLHPEIFMERLDAGTVRLLPTDKDYKVYVQPEFGSDEFLQMYRTGDQGGDPAKWVWKIGRSSMAKFYFPHFDDEQRVRFTQMLADGKLKFMGAGTFPVLPYFIKVMG